MTGFNLIGRGEPARAEAGWLPELHLAGSELAWIDRFVEDHTLPTNRGKPICVIDPWPNDPGGMVVGSQAPEVFFWDALVREHADRYRFWQVGGADDSCVQGCEYYFLARATPRHLRRCFALIRRAQAVLGTELSDQIVPPTRRRGFAVLVARGFGIPAMANPSQPEEARSLLLAAAPGTIRR